MARARPINRYDQRNADRWESGGRKRFARWASRDFLPEFERGLHAATDSIAGDIFGESVFDAFLLSLSSSSEANDISKHFGYPAADSTDDALMGMWGQTVSNLRLRHPDRRGRQWTPTSVYENDYVVLKGIAQTLGA